MNFRSPPPVARHIIELAQNPEIENAKLTLALSFSLVKTDAETARSTCERICLAFRNTGHVIGSDHARARMG